MVGTALRAVRNDARLMLRLWYFAARSAIAPYRLSHRLARCLQYVANVQVLPVSNWQLADGIGYWQQLARSPPSSATRFFSFPHTLTLARRPASRRKNVV